MNSTLFLCGMMGCGKSFYGQRLASELELPFFDLDSMIETDEDVSISEIFKSKGEAFFRSLELSHITRILEKNQEAIIALGGGAVCFNRVDDMLAKQSNLIYLQSSAQNIYNRIKNETHRPILLDENQNPLGEKKTIGKLSTLINARSEHYEKAHLQLNVDEFATDEVIAEIKDYYEQRIRRS